MKKVIGITGGIATGKSYVTNFLKHEGFEVIDTDKICHYLEQPGHSGFLAIEKEFKNVVTNGVLDRKKLGTIIFDNKEKRLRLNEILHPLIKDETKRQIEKAKGKIIFLDVPLLFEANFDDLCDEIITVYTEPEIQIKRLMIRDDLDNISALKRIQSQMSLKEKIKKSHYVIKSEIDFNKTNENILEVLKRIKEKYNG